MYLPKAPCKDCSDRSAECHGSCKKYINFKAEYEEKQRELDKINAYYGYKKESIYRRKEVLALTKKRKGG